MAVDVNDYVEDPEAIDDSPYLASKRMLVAFHNRMNEFEKKLNEVTADYKDSQRSHAVGVQNVYDKFVEFEVRQKEIEVLLKSERIYEVIKAIPNEEDIRSLLLKIESTEMGKLNKHLRRIREDLEELSSAFNY